MISITDLTKSFGDQIIFKDATFNINTRERIGLVGRNGSGKTTLFNILNGTIAPDSGQVMFPRHYRIGHVEQHLKFTESTTLREGCLGLPEDQIHDEWRVEKILFGLGFSKDQMDADPMNLSGGYQVRLNLAKVLISSPHLLLLDEPTNFLDIVSIRWLSSFLRSWPGELILITHDRQLMTQIVTHSIAIHRQRVRKIEGGPDKLYAQIASDEEIYEKTRINDEKKQKDVEAYIERFRAKASFASSVQSRVKALEKRDKKEKLAKIENLEFTFRYKPYTSKRLVDVANLEFGYPDLESLFEYVNFSVHTYDRIGIIGQNGKGKTTLLRLITQELEPRSGEITYQPGVEYGYFGQTNIQRLNQHLSIEEELLLSDPDKNRTKVRSICGAMMFSGDLAQKQISILSGGEKSRVMLGKILLQPTNLLILDEPTNHLDMESCDALLGAIDEFKGAVLMVTHNEMFLHAICNRLIIFDNDMVTVFEGSYQDFLDQVGWIGEQSDKPVTKPASKLTPAEKRRKRAQLLTEKNQKLKTVSKHIHTLETEIDGLQHNLKTLHLEIIEAGKNGRMTMNDSLIKQHELDERIKDLYNQLEDALDTHSTIESEFEPQLAELSD